MSDFIPHPAGSEIGRRSVQGATIQNKYIEHGAHCDNMPEGGECSLSSGVRTRLITAYQQNVIAAHIQFSSALTEIHLEALMEKPEEIPLFISLAIDALTLFVGTAVGKALKMLRTAPASTLTALDIMAGQVDQQNQFMELVRGVDPTWLASMGISQGKKAAAGTLAAANEDAQKTVDYAGAISDASALAFEHQRQDPPGYASDAELVALFHSWSASMGHTKNQYKAALAGVIARFKASGASKVGRQFVNADKDPHHEAGMVMRDTQLVAIFKQDDEAPEMWLYKKDYKATWFQKERDMQNPVQPVAEKFDGEAYEESFVKWKKVEPEFIDQAMLANQTAWGTPYEKRYEVSDYMKFTRKP